MKTLFALSLAALVLLSADVHAGTWSTKAWTDDASTGIVDFETIWAYHCGASTTATINGVSVPGLPTAPATVANKVEIGGVSAVIASDDNQLTALGGTGSAVMARSFFYAGNPVTTVTVKAGSPLVQGKDYVVSFFSVGWDAAPLARQLTFHSGADQLSVNQDMFGENFGVRVDYAFTAGAGDQTVTIDWDPTIGTFHLYAVALRAIPDALVVTSTADAGVGSLRQTIGGAASGTPTSITFASNLSGQTINLTSGEIGVNTPITLDASSLPQGITIQGNGAGRLFFVGTTGRLSGSRLTLTGGAGVSFGGAIENQGTLGLRDCALRNNSSIYGGGAVDNAGSTASATLTNCTLHDNSSGNGGAIDNYLGTTTLLNCTFTRNRSPGLGAVIYNENGGTTQITHCTVVENFFTTVASNGAVYSISGPIIVSNSIIAGNGGGDVAVGGGSIISTGGNVIGTGNATTSFTQTGDVTGKSAAQLGLAELGRYGGFTDTMPPMPGSPALDAAVNSTATTDQRGFARSVDGDFAGSAVSDSGAVESFVVRCNIVSDELETPVGLNHVSLREAVRDAPAGAVIASHSSFFNNLTLGELVVNKSLIFAPSSLNSRWNLSSGFSKRGFYIAPGVRVHFWRINFNGNTAPYNGSLGAVESGKGGAILNQGNLSVSDSIFSSMAADYGGAIANGLAATPSQLLLRRCTVNRSTAVGSGGAIYNASGNGGAATVELENCILNDNISGLHGGAVANLAGNGNATVNAVHCTVINNKAASSGGGVYNGQSSGTATSMLASCVVAGNKAPAGTDVQLVGGTFTSGGTNLIGVADTGGVTWSGSDLKGTAAVPLSPQLDTTFDNFNPLPGSPLLDAAAATTIILDRKSQPRSADGDFSGNALPDIGAVEAAAVSVTTAADELDTPAGPNVSLREAIRDVGLNGIIRVNAALNGQTLTLDQARGEITISKSFSLDASQIPGGFTIDGGPGANRIFTLNSSAIVLLRKLTLQGGAATGDGGAILVTSGRLTLEDCVVTGNTATGSGGGLAVNSGSNLTVLTRCAFTNNSAGLRGGGVSLDSVFAFPANQLSQCTFEGNRSALRGGGLYAAFTNATVDQCTFTRNTAATQRGGGVVLNPSFYTVTLSNSIIADNLAPQSPDLVVDSDNFIRSGSNLIGVQPVTGLLIPSGLPNANGDYVGTSAAPAPALLSPMGFYGGFTPSCLPMQGSAALDHAVGVTTATDQRGFARSVDGDRDGTAAPDIGAAESVMVRVDVASDELDTPAGTNDVSLREAVRDAPLGAVIGFAPALSGQTIRLATIGTLSPARSMVISGSGLAQPVTLTAAPGPSGFNALFVSPSVSVGLSHLRFFGCSAPFDGGAILNFGKLGIGDCDLSYNSNTSTAGIGGAIYSGTSGQSCRLKMTRCVLSGNYSILGNGGALINRSTAAGLTAELLLEDCVFSGNSAMAATTGVGGAVSNIASNGTALFTARRCTFADNQSAARGGAVGNSASNAASTASTLLESCTFSGNACPFGVGGAVASGSSAGTASCELRQCTLFNNRTNSSGAAVINLGLGGNASLQVKQCTISGNNGDGIGGAVTNSQPSVNGAATTTIETSVVAANLPVGSTDVRLDGGGTINSLGNNLIGNITNSLVIWPSGDLFGTGPASLDPLLAPLDFYGGPTQTMPPLPGSPAREPASGATSALGQADQRGFPRLIGTKVDIGAVEADAPDAPGVIAFATATLRVNEGDAPALIPVYRTAGKLGTVTVKASTSTGSGTGFATAPDDFTAVTNYLLTFGTGETVKYVPITIVADPALKEPNETFTLTLSDVTGNASLGAQSSATVRIVDAVDASLPTLTLTAPAVNAIVLEANGPTVTVSGTAKDDKGIQSVQVQLNGGAFVDATLSGPLTAPGFSLPVTAVAGLNSLVVRAIDEKGKISALTKRSFTYKVTKPLTVAISGPANSGTVSAGFVPTSQRDVGVKYTITAVPKPGFVFSGWNYSLPSQPQPPSIGITNFVSLELPTITFIMQPGLSISASFRATEFTPANVGTYTGLILPSTTLPAPNGTTPGNANTGLLTVTLTSAGSLISGSLKIDGASLPFTALFTGAGGIRFGTGATFSDTLKLIRSGKPDLELTLLPDYYNPTGKRFFGTLTQKVGGVTVAVSDIFAYRTGYSAAAKVPTTLVSGASQRFNLTFPPGVPPTGFTAAQFPPGTGVGFLTVSSAGACTYAGTLADGTPFTASAPLNDYNQSPLFCSLYAAQGHLAGLVNLVSPTTPGYDTYGAHMLWNRPAQLPTKVQWYPAGWPTSINLEMVGAKFTVPAVSANQSVIPGLGALDGTNIVGNATLTCMDGLLSSPRTFPINISTKNLVTPLPLRTTQFTLGLTAATGELSGTFLHTDGTKPAFKATTLQKPGDYQGSYGWFLTFPPKVINGQGQGGAVMVLPR